MTMMNESITDYDTPWKEAIEDFFPDCIQFFLPKAYAEIDWKHGYVFLDKEFQQVIQEAKIKKRMVDKLVQVWQKNGKETWVLIHLEVQVQKDMDFAHRMYVYHSLIFHRYRRPVVSLAILGDEHPQWKPEEFGYNLWGCEIRFHFPVVKLLELAQTWRQLENNRNPFAVVVSAHLKNLQTRNDTQDRFLWKLAIARKLYDRGLSREKIIRLFHFIDGLMKLPKDLEEDFWKHIIGYEEEKQMPYVSPIERLLEDKYRQQGILQGLKEGMQQGKQEGIQQGKQEGMQQGIQQGIQQGMQQGTLEGIRQEAQEAVIDLLCYRFDHVPKILVEQIRKIQDIPFLRILRKEAIQTKTLKDFKQVLKKLDKNEI